MNDVLARLPGLRRLCLMQVMVARPLPEPKDERDLTVSVIVPCRNERGNVQPAVERIPPWANIRRFFFCDDNSTDGTADEVRRMLATHPKRTSVLIPDRGYAKPRTCGPGFEPLGVTCS